MKSHNDAAKAAFVALGAGLIGAGTKVQVHMQAGELNPNVAAKMDQTLDAGVVAIASDPDVELAVTAKELSDFGRQAEEFERKALDMGLLDIAKSARALRIASFTAKAEKCATLTVRPDPPRCRGCGTSMSMYDCWRSWMCDFCGAGYHGARYRCDPCDFVVCNSCLRLGKDVVVNPGCLLCTFTMGFVRAEGAWTCGRCKKEFPTQVHLRCNQFGCDCNLCDSCAKLPPLGGGCEDCRFGAWNEAVSHCAGCKRDLSAAGSPRLRVRLIRLVLAQIAAEAQAAQQESG